MGVALEGLCLIIEHSILSLSNEGKELEDSDGNK